MCHTLWFSAAILFLPEWWRYESWDSRQARLSRKLKLWRYLLPTRFHDCLDTFLALPTGRKLHLQGAIFVFASLPSIICALQHAPAAQPHHSWFTLSSRPGSGPLNTPFG